jgi:glycosyltransferase involved in cell wall biosynthesis
MKLVEATRLKVILVHNAIAPYRHAVFETLAQKVDLQVYYCSDLPRPWRWDQWPRNYNYHFSVLPKLAVKSSIGEFYLNPSLVGVLLRKKPNVLIISGYTDPSMWLAFVLGRLLRIPIVHWTEGIEEPKSLLGLLTRSIRSLSVQKPDAIIVPGKLSMEYAVGLGGQRESVFVAANSMDNELYNRLSDKYQSQKEKLKAEIGFTGKIVILFVGRLVKEKGITYLLEAYRRLKRKNPNIALVMVGYGDMYDSIKRLLQQNNITDVILTGAIESSEEIVKYYSLSDIFVLPTLHDVWGFVINEAMLCGLPIVATSASQAALEMIHPGVNGYIVKKANSEELYAAIQSLVSDDKRREEMGKRSREIANDEFSVQHMTDGFLKAIEYSLNKTKK